VRRLRIIFDNDTMTLVRAQRRMTEANSLWTKVRHCYVSTLSPGINLDRHCEERSDEAIQGPRDAAPGLLPLRSALGRNDVVTLSDRKVLSRGIFPLLSRINSAVIPLLIPLLFRCYGRTSSAVRAEFIAGSLGGERGFSAVWRPVRLPDVSQRAPISYAAAV
jgi:hypothetical protein